jgi:hypothetical protein
LEILARLVTASTSINPKFMDFTKAGTYILEEAIDIFEIFGLPPYIPDDPSFILSDYVSGDTYLWLISI